MALTPLSHTMSESAEILNISLSKLWVLVRQGKLASYKVGKRRYISRAALERFVRESEEAAALEREHSGQSSPTWITASSTCK